MDVGGRINEKDPNSAPSSKVNIDSFRLLKVLGKGSFGKVMLV